MQRATAPLEDLSTLRIGTGAAGRRLDRQRRQPEQRVPLHYTGQRHLLTVAPTRAGKGVSMIIPNLLTYRGSTTAAFLRRKTDIFIRQAVFDQSASYPQLAK